MDKTPDPDEVVRDKLVPAAEELVASVAERLGPLARDAYDALTPFAQQTVAAITPYAQQAAGTVAPYASQAAGAVAPYAALVREQGRKTGHDLSDRLEPAYEAAKDALASVRDKVTGDVLPAVGAAASTAAASAAASPLVTSVAERGKALIQTEPPAPVVVPDPPKRRRGLLVTFAAVAAAAAAAYVVVRKVVGDKGSQWQTARPTTPYVPPTSAAAADVVASTDQPADSGAAAVVPDLTTTSPPAGGDVPEPSTMSMYGAGAPVSPGATRVTVDDDSAAIAARTEEVDHVADVDEATSPIPTAGSGEQHTDAGAGGTRPAVGAEGAPAPGDEPRSPYGEAKLETELETVEERAYEEPEDAVTTEQDTAMGLGPDAHPDRYDLPGVYLGTEPPEGYQIKGNERSMKYHLPTSNSYARTIAEVWFDSEEAAERAGFSRAQH